MDFRPMEKINYYKLELKKIEHCLNSNSDFDENMIYRLKSKMLYYKLNNPQDQEIDTLIQLVDNLDASHDKQENKKLNHRLNLLTIWSTIFLPLSFYTGMWGMNFDDVPLLTGDDGFWVFAGLTLLTIGVMFTYFKRNKWF